MECSVQMPTSHFNTDFCLLMSSHVLLKEALAKGSNFVISPLSFHVLLSLIAVGSRGRTLQQLLSFLGSKNIQDLTSLSSQLISLALPANHENNHNLGGPTLSFINGVWVAEGYIIKPSFEEIVRGVYNATAKEVDFENKADEVINKINTWAENSTNGLIKNLIPQGAVPRDTVLVLANALYFKGTWAKKFDVLRTQHRDFHLLSGQTVTVPFMTSQKPALHLYGSFDGYKILKLPYRNGQDTRQFSMYFFLPEARHGLQNLVNRSRSNPKFFNTQFNLQYEELPDMWVPRFKFSFEFEASKTMMDLGLELPFQSINKEITEMVDRPLFVEKMFHKSYIEVNEEGTEAAACTAAIIIPQCLRYPIPSFVADHPFMFMIREETSNAVFFVGAILNPFLES
ncbi:serpin-ZX-like [Pistacia vera]|uniref:serpin-ZX-like n=1 Tax=Pistacia vera TaxID=55513 RepID=UPI0012635A65|nr:serpin-ZX-like [Pistacia vera]